MTAPELPENDWRRAVYGRSQIGGIGIRRAPRLAERIRVQEAQGNRCLYCELPIGTAIWRRAQTVILRTNWDHFVPYSYLARNPDNNWVLACHVCNGIKTARMFDTVQTARQVILPVREAKGYEDPKSVLLRLGLEASDDPWPEQIRVKNGTHYHAARVVRSGVYLSACGMEISADQSAVIRRHQVQCRRCTLARDIPVVPPASTPREMTHE